ncbi:MAG: hypothetical protein MI806_22460 [Minwuiales bacterium]|nr:hypothetical protein [Minwuiales bacterium]
MANIAKRASEADGKAFLRNAFALVHNRLAFDLEEAARTITHDGKRGEVTERDWLRVIRSYLPNRYAVESGIIIDSDGKTSDQIDIVIYDPHYTPTLLTRESNRYIPAEAVYVVLEAKPNINKDRLEYAGAKAASVRQLKRTSVPIVHAGGVYKARPVFEITAGIVAARVDWADGFGRSFRQVMESPALSGENRIDCGCGLSHGAFDIFSEDKALTFGEEDAGLVFFLFRLLNRLQSLGTVPAIDWNAYASVLKMSHSD